MKGGIRDASSRVAAFKRERVRSAGGAGLCPSAASRTPQGGGAAEEGACGGNPVSSAHKKAAEVLCTFGGRCMPVYEGGAGFLIFCLLSAVRVPRKGDSPRQMSGRAAQSDSERRLGLRYHRWPGRSGRVVEGGALLRRYGGNNLLRGFESLLLRFLRACPAGDSIVDAGDQLVAAHHLHGDACKSYVVARVLGE